MKRFALYIGIVTGLIVSCSVQEEEFEVPSHNEVMFYASFEQPVEEETRVYADEDLHLRWTANDRVSIFNKVTYNQQYKFLGETGDNSGGFAKVDNAEFVTGNPISYVVSVYPYQQSTKITEGEVVTLALPAEQHYAENTFGLGDNTMVSVSEDNVLQYKNVGGYLMLKLYGESVSVSTITLKGNNGEKLAGKASILTSLNGTPAVTMDPAAATEITLTCASPVQLGATAEESTQFWLVVPPVVFDNGFTVIINQEFGVSTEKTIVLERNKVTKMAPIKVTSSHPDNVIYYTSSDGQIIMPSGVDYFGNVSAYFYESYGANYVSNEYKNGIGTITFDAAVKYIANDAFRQSNLTSISLPNSVTSIGYQAFHQCEELSSITVPEQVTYIGDDAFRGCSNLTGITLLPATPPQIGNYVFQNASPFPVYVPVNSYETYRAERGYPSSWIVPIGVYSYISYTSIDNSIVPTVNAYNAFVVNNEYNYGSGTITYAGCLSYIAERAFSNTNLTSINLPETITRIDNAAFWACDYLSQVIIPETVTTIGPCSFYSCTSLLCIEVPERVTEIGESAFQGCRSLTSITVRSAVPPQGGKYMFDDTNECPIFVPANSVWAYKSEQNWSDYADRIQPIPINASPIPETVDMGLSVKWASFNLGARIPEEFGDLYAWGEIEPYYEIGFGYWMNMNPVWKSGKESGYDWASYVWCMGKDYTLTKYCSDSSCGYLGYTDSKTVLDFEDDAAYVNLGGKWRMPTDAEWTELRENCIWTGTELNGFWGKKVTSTINGNSIFLPAAERNGYVVGQHGYYWSSSLNEGSPRSAWVIGFSPFDSSDVSRYSSYRYYGHSIRPVYAD